jgi:hypothetical protein
MKNNSILYVGGAAVLAYLFLKGTPSTANAASSPSDYPYLVPGAPPLPSTWDFNYYLSYIYPAMQKANPEILNSRHVLTPAEASQYEANYQDVQEWVPVVTGPGQQFAGNPLAALQYHWNTGGIPDRRTFLPLMPPATAPGYVPPPPVNPNSSGSGSGSAQSWVSTALTVASVVAMFLGTGDEVLNDYDINVLLNGSAVVKEILPMYYIDGRALNIENKLTALLNQYTA